MHRLPNALAASTFATFQPVPGSGPALEAARAFARQPAGWLTLYGPNGNGKSHLAAAVYHELEQRAADAWWVSVPAFLDWLRAGFNPQAGDAGLDSAARFDRVLAAGVLILDDLGAEQWTPWVEERLYRLVDGRLGYARPTLVTTNVGPDGFDDAFGPRIGSRLRRGCMVLNSAPEWRGGR